MSAHTFKTSLVNAGFISTDITLSVRITCDKRDAEWNYSDVPHLNVIHSQVKQSNIHISKNVIANIFAQRVLGFRINLPVVILHTDPDSHFYYTTAYGFWIAVETRYVQTNCHECIISTTYTVWSRPYLSLLHNIVLRLITKNYNILNSEDQPMRLQRGWLRKSNNYEFQKDTLKLIGFNDTVNVSEKNIRFSQNTKHVALPIKQLSDSKGNFQHALQLFLERQDNLLVIRPALCEHEGACLVTSKHGCDVNSPKLSDRGEDLIWLSRCPWHGKKIHHLARIPLSPESTCSFDYLGLKYTITVDATTIYIQTHAA